MRYHELFERDYGKIIADLQALIDHPSTEPALRDSAQKKLVAIQAKVDSEKVDLSKLCSGPSKFKPVSFRKVEKEDEFEPDEKPKGQYQRFTPRAF